MCKDDLTIFFEVVEKGWEGLQEHASAVPPAKPIYRPWDRATLQLLQVLRAWCDAVCESGKDYAMDKETGRCKEHDNPKGRGHGKYPHINIRCPDGKQVLIDIIGK